MKKIIFLFLFFSVFFSYSQTVVVIDAETGNPVANVAIFNQDKMKSQVTDFDGKADLSAFLDDERITFKLFGYRQKRLLKSELAASNWIVKIIAQSENLEEVVLSLSKWEQQRKEIPLKIGTIKEELIVFSNPQTSADLLQNSGQVFVQKSQLGGGSPLIRGFATNRVLTSVDGVRFNTAIFRGGNVQNVISIDPFTVESTEIIFGPGSVTYGSDAVGGVMNFYTKEAKLSTDGKVQFNANVVSRFSTANEEKTEHIDFGLGWKKWAIFSSFTYSQFGDLRQGSNGPDEFLRTFLVERINGEDVVVANEDPLNQSPSGYEQINFFQKVTFNPNDKWNFDLSLTYTTTSDYDRYDRLIEVRENGLPRSAVWFYGPQVWFSGNFQVNKKGNGVLYDNVSFTNAYQHFEESRNDRNFGSDFFNVQIERVDAFSSNLDFEKKFHERTNLFYGLEYVINRVNSEATTENIITNDIVDAQTRYPDGSTWQSVAAYVNLEHKFNSKLTLLSGLRYNYISLNAEFDNQFFDFPFQRADIDTGALTGSVGVSWLPEKSIQLTLNAGTAFRAPNIDDTGRIFDSEPGSVVVPNPDLEREYAYNFEFGFRKNFYDRVTLRFATYYTLLDDALVRRDFNLNGETEIEFQGELSNVQAIQNAARAFVYGFEFGLDVYISESLTFNSNLTFTEGDEELDDGSTAPLRHVAPTFGDAHLVWQQKKLKLDLFGNFSGEIPFDDLPPSEGNKPFLFALDENGNPFAASWYTLNIRSQYKFTDHIESNIALENITDQRYRTFSSGISAPGRNLVIGLKYTF